jgi:hypothetical protein
MDSECSFPAWWHSGEYDSEQTFFSTFFQINGFVMNVAIVELP